MKTMLLATDGSDSSEQALAFAIELARDTGSWLDVVSVRPQWPSTRGLAATLEADDTATDIADRAVARAQRAGISSRAHVLDGDTVRCIIDTARRVRAELLVVGSRGLGSMSGAILGSVSLALVRRSPIPVTIVRQTHVRSAVRT